jgi:amidase
MPELTEKSLVALAAMIQAGEVSPVEVMEAHLRRVGRINPQLRAVVTLNPQALEQARTAEKAVTAQEKLRPLHGVPVTVKDTIETAGLRTTAGSRLLKRHVPESDAPAVWRLKAAGAIILGKTNASELAVAYDSDNPVGGRTCNPYDLARSPGGSSGGEAAAIAACLSPGGVGSDLAGSIRIPAHFCGVVGLKPTNGLVPNEGQWPRAVGPLGLGAAIGPMARNVADALLLFEILHWRRRAGSRNFVEPESFLASRAQRLRGQRFLWYADDGQTPVDNDVKAAVTAAVKVLTANGMRGEHERPPGIEHGPRLWHELFAHAAAQQLSELYEGRETEAGPSLQALFKAHAQRQKPNLEGYMKSWAERDQRRDELLQMLEKTPLIIAPVGSFPAPAHDTRKVSVNSQEVGLWPAFGYAQTYNVFGLPAVSVPTGLTPEGLPVGAQIIGRPCAEHEILAAASLIEATLGGWRKSPQFP